MLPIRLQLVLVSVILVLLPTITVCLSPPPTSAAAGKLVNSAIWIYGGNSGSYLKTLWSLDVSRSFSLDSPPWTDHSSDGANLEFVYARNHITLETDADEKVLWLYGGGNSATDNQIITYDINGKSWSIPSIQGNPLAVYKSAVARNNGTLYYFGGASAPFTRIDTVQSLNTVTGEYKIIPATPSNLPGRFGHTVTAVGKNIYVIGGGTAINETSLHPEPMNIINIFDTTNNVWTHRNTTGNDFPLTRFRHTAALTSDSKNIIIFGGTITKGNQLNDVWILDIANLSWTRGTTTGIPPVNLADCNAFIVGNQMLVMFGVTVRNNIEENQNKIYVLDMSITPWTWVETFTSPNLSTITTSKTTTAETTSTVETSSTAATSIPHCGSSDINLNFASKAALVSGGSAILLVAGLLVCFFMKRKHDVRHDHESPEDAPPSYSPQEVNKDKHPPSEMDLSEIMVLKSHPSDVAFGSSGTGGIGHAEKGSPQRAL